jgi:hypothetical protein
MGLYRQKQLIEGMRTVRKNTIQIAEHIPEKDYGYRASFASRSVTKVQEVRQPVAGRRIASR